MKVKVFKLCIAMVLCSHLSAQAFDKSFAIGIMGQFTANIYPYKNTDLTVKYKNTTLDKLKQEYIENKSAMEEKAEKNIQGIKDKITFDEQQNKYLPWIIKDGKKSEVSDTEKEFVEQYNNYLKNINVTEASIRFFEKVYEEDESLAYKTRDKTLSQSLTTSAGLGVKLMKIISKKTILDLSIFASKDVHTGSIKIDEKSFEFTKTNDFFENIKVELNLGFLFNVIDFSPHTSLYAGAGAIYAYNWLNKNLTEGIDESFEINSHEYKSIATDTFTKDKYTAGAYVTIQILTKATESILMGTGLKFHGTFLNSPFGDVTSIDGIENADLIETGLSGMLFITYLV